MKLQVENFGPIKKGEIDLSKRFYVFVGYNNSGKTYMANLLWSLYRLSPFNNVFNLINKKVIDNEVPSSIVITEKQISYYISSFEKIFIKELLPKDLFIHHTNSIVSKAGISFLEQHYKNFLELEINHITTIESNYLERQRFIFEKKKYANSINISYELMSNEDVEKLMKTSKISSTATMSQVKNNVDAINRSILGLLSRSLFKEYLFPFFLPANRIFFPTYYKYVYSVANEEKQRLRRQLQLNPNDLEVLKDLSKIPYTQSIEELVNRYFNLGQWIPHTDANVDLMIRVEKIMGGKLITRQTEGLAPTEFKLELEDNNEIDLYLSSSASNQLTSLYLYFKYWSWKSNNLLIIDEPEANLHPKNQKALLNILLDFASRNNNKVIITTHSPFLTKTINNHILIAHLQEKGIELNGVQNNEQIFRNFTTDDYGIYFFNGEEILNYEVGDYGAYFKDFEEEEEKVSRLSNILKSKVFQMENK